MKKVTMQDIADRLNISKASVSLALNGKPGISEETRLLVHSLANKLGYSATEIKQECKNIIIFIPEYIQNDIYFYNEVYWSMEHASSQNGYSTFLSVISSSMQQSNTLPSICNQISYVGIITVGVLDYNYMKFLSSITSSLISVDNIYYGLNIKSIVTSNIEGSYQITQQVIQHKHKEIGFIGPYNMTSSIYERWCGFVRAMNEHNLPINPDYMICDDSPLDSLYSSEDELSSYIKNMNKLPSAFVCAGDRIAISLIKVLNRFGYSIPNDISVVGFDNIEISEYLVPHLTTMQTFRKNLGETAVQVLINPYFYKDINTISIPPKFIQRNSLSIYFK